MLERCKRLWRLAIAYVNIPAVPVEWLWYGRIALAQLTLIAGDAGIGKGFFGADLVARITRGNVMPDGTPGIMAGNVITVTPEDDPNSAMRYRLDAAGADVSRVYDFTDGFETPASLPALREAMHEIGNVRMVWLDPASAVSGASLTSGSRTIRRQLMEPLQQLAKDTGAAVVLVHHTRKDGKIAGSKAIIDAARMVLRIMVAATPPFPRLIHLEKSNIASDKIGDVAYTITGEWPDTRVEFVATSESVSVDTPAESTETHPGLRTRITLVLARASAPMSTQDVTDAVDAPYGTVRVALSRMGKDDTSPVFSPERGAWWSHDAMERIAREEAP